MAPRIPVPVEASFPEAAGRSSARGRPTDGLSRGKGHANNRVIGPGYVTLKLAGAHRIRNVRPLAEGGGLEREFAVPAAGHEDLLERDLSEVTVRAGRDQGLPAAAKDVVGLEDDAAIARVEDAYR